MTEKIYDAIIVGSGAGGSAAAYVLANAGLHIALIEKGHALPRDSSTLDASQIATPGRFKSDEVWQESNGGRFCPQEYFNLGGKTKWYGAALLRNRPHEFDADPMHQCLAWPIGYDDLAPYYAQAESLLGVRQFKTEPSLQLIIDRLAKRSPTWRNEPLVLGLSADIQKHSVEARHFDGFASPTDLKKDAQTVFLNLILDRPNVDLIGNLSVTELLSQSDATKISGVRMSNGVTIQGRTVLLAAGALHSPRLLQRYIETHGLAEKLPCFANVGANFKMHVSTVMVVVSPSVKTDLLRKTTLFLEASLPHSSVQPLGFDGEYILGLISKFVPRAIARPVSERAYAFLLQTEDGSHRDNRVKAGSAATQNLSLLDYSGSRTPAAVSEHRHLIGYFRGALLRAGMLAFSRRVGVNNTANASGTLITGKDPGHSVVDPMGQVHGLKSLYVVDGSILPRLSRVGPALTIYAWALRVAEIVATRLK